MQLKSCLFVFIIMLYYKKIHGLNANGVDPDQTLQLVSSDLGLHCLRNARHKWVKYTRF